MLILTGNWAWAICIYETTKDIEIWNASLMKYNTQFNKPTNFNQMSKIQTCIHRQVYSNRKYNTIPICYLAISLTFHWFNLNEHCTMYTIEHCAINVLKTTNTRYGTQLNAYHIWKWKMYLNYIQIQFSQLLNTKIINNNNPVKSKSTK